MVDTTFNNASAGWNSLKARDLGDGTTAMSVWLEAGKFVNIAGAATTVVKNGAGTLRSIIVNKAISSGVITVYDNTAASGTKIATVTNPLTLLSNQFSMPYNVRFDTGLTIVTSAADDITIIYF